MDRPEDYSARYHQAAFAYLLNAVFYFFVATFRMPPHDFGIWGYLFYTLGAVFAIIFPYLIYKEYRVFTAILAIVYLVRSLVSLIVVPYYSILMIFTFLIHVFTCFMLARAAWNIKIFHTILNKRKDDFSKRITYGE